MAKMMDKKGLEYWQRQFEIRAAEDGARGDYTGWLLSCTKLWTIEFVMGLGDDPETYQQPMNRIPFAPKARQS